MPRYGVLKTTFSTAVVNTASDVSGLLRIARALGVGIRDAHLGRRVLADEVQHAAQGAVHAFLEAPAQTHIEQRVEATVEIGQAQR